MSGIIHETDAALARALGIRSQVLSQWRKKFDDHPQSLSESDWLAFKAKHDLGVTKAGMSKGREELYKEKLTTEIRLNNLKIAKEERRMIPADEVDDFHLFLASRLKSQVYLSFTTELPPKTAGLDVADVRRHNREAADSFCVVMQGLIAEYEEQQKAAAAAVVELTP